MGNKKPHDPQLTARGGKCDHDQRNGLLSLMGELYALHRVEAIALGSAVIDMRITQIVNGVKGVHACLPHDAFK